MRCSSRISKLYPVYTATGATLRGPNAAKCYRWRPGKYVGQAQNTKTRTFQKKSQKREQRSFVLSVLSPRERLRTARHDPLHTAALRDCLPCRRSAQQASQQGIYPSGRCCCLPNYEFTASRRQCVRARHASCHTTPCLTHARPRTRTRAHTHTHPVRGVWRDAPARRGTPSPS